MSEFSSHLQKLLETKLWAKIIAGMALGVGVGLLLAPKTGIVSPSFSHAASQWLGFPGMLFIKLVQMIMIPLIFSSIITGIASNSELDKLKKVGINLVLYFLSTTAIAVVIGSAITGYFKPGSYFQFETAASEGINVQAGGTLPAWSDLPNAIGNLLPSNPLASMVTGEMLSIVIFTIIIGVALTFMSKAGAQPILNLLSSVQEICMTIVRWAMVIAPYAVFGLMAQLIVSVGLSSLYGLGIFMLTVVAGLILLLLVYMILVVLLARRSPRALLRSIRDVQLLAFSTASSAAVMPLSMKTAEEKLGVSPFIAKFIVPIGATINMDGTALFQCAATLFIAQVYGIELATSTLALLIFTIIASSIGTPAIPGGGILVMGTVLQSVGLPMEGIMMLVGIDRIMGMLRTAVNVTGDMVACVVFDRWFGDGVKQAN